MEKHYTCTECGGEAEAPQVCQDENCVKQGQDMTECHCTDGEHGGENEEGYYAR